MKNTQKMENRTVYAGCHRAGCRLLARDRYVSNDSWTSHLNLNDLIVGASGSGKSGGYVEPFIRMADHSMVIADTKGRLYRKYRDYLKKKGFQVRCIDFVHPEHSDAYNPLDHVGRWESGQDGGYRESDLRKIASLLIRDHDHDPFWSDAARNILVSLMAYAIEVLPKEEQHIGSVARLFALLTEEINKKDARGNRQEAAPFFEELIEEDPDSYAGRTYLMYKGTCTAEKCWASIAQFVANALEVFLCREAKPLFLRSSEPLYRIGREKTALFLGVSDTERSMDPMINCFYAQLFQQLCDEADNREDGRLKVPVRIVLDDFASNVVIPDFDKIMSVVRSREIYVSIILQSISQLDGLYNRGQAATIVNNCDTMLYLGGTDPDTCEYFARKAGRLPETIKDTDVTHAWLFIRGRQAEEVERFAPYSMDEDDGNVRHCAAEYGRRMEGKE